MAREVNVADSPVTCVPLVHAVVLSFTHLFNVGVLSTEYVPALRDLVSNLHKHYSRLER